MGYSAKQRRRKVRIEGADRLVRELKSMDGAAKAVLMNSAQAGGKIALKDAKENCPVDSGALQASLKLTDVKSSVTRGEVKLDYDRKLKYGTFVELGANGRQANPFMRNAVDNNQDKINTAIVHEIISAIDKKL